jgi:glycerol uptake facilitator protein
MDKRIIFGELIGTFVLVFFGIGSVAVTVLYDTFNLFQIATVWCFAVIGGIYASKKWSDAHLNLAVSVGFLIQKEINSKQLLNYAIGQFIGSTLAGLAVYLIFATDITSFEASHNIIRGLESSKTTAMMFGEFYPNPGNKDLKELSTISAMALEAIGTFLLMSMILLLVNSNKINHRIIPTLIGITVGILIVFIAPYTQAGFNPFRDLAPRLVSAIMGWESIVFDLKQFGFITVYVLGPILGASIASLLFKTVVKK